MTIRSIYPMIFVGRWEVFYMTQTEDKIIQFIKDMSEEEVKLKFAELMLNHYRIGFGGYSKEKCMNDYEGIYRDIVLRDLWK